MSEDTYLTPTSIKAGLKSDSTTDDNQLPTTIWTDADTTQSADGTGANPTYTIADILRSTNYGLSIFSQEEVEKIQLFDKNGKPYLRDFVNGKERPANPEEIVRQLFLYRLIYTYLYPVARIAVEKGIQFGSSIADKRADIVINEKNYPDTVYIIVELKKPKRHEGLEQLKSYCNATGAPIGVWTNGSEIEVWHREDPNLYRKITDLPRSDQTLSQIINEKVTLDELIKRNKLVTENLTLKNVIQDLEDLVLANAGVDAFEEVFKLVYAKLYDEWSAENNPSRKRLVRFRASGETHQELYEKINGLFLDAMKQWPGVFLKGESIDLTATHLAVCVSFLQDTKLFNSNLQVIDEAFEYLVTQVSKGEKGQYFTPRHVIDMAVKMLDPKWEEYVIDTAAGSCGFTVHSIFHVWGGELTAHRPEQWQLAYASEKVYGLDFDARSVKIAKAINLIAGDGRSHVYRVNTLDPSTWDNKAKEGLADHLMQFSDELSRNDWNLKNYRFFDFDLLLTNPPFAGDIKDTRILHQYDIAKPDNGKWQSSMGRDILFIERNLEFIKPSGRMAIVLPQGRFNNIGDEYIRRFISERCRILAVVGLNVNTFKPHTGTKTSVLFLQKWNDDPAVGPLCIKIDDYPIFFAVSQYPGKDSSGEYVFLKGPDGKDLLDLFGHKIVDQDLYDTRREITKQLERLLERDQGNPSKCNEHQRRYNELLLHIPQRPTIAEAFIHYAKDQGFSFWRKG